MLIFFLPGGLLLLLILVFLLLALLLLLLLVFVVVLVLVVFVLLLLLLLPLFEFLQFARTKDRLFRASRSLVFRRRAWT